jgi:aryl-alcohol dehydrogenase-like predicted oxidoreductase
VIATRTLGRTGLAVSAIGFGTVSLGLDYGIAAPDRFGRPGEAEAVATLRRAADAGVTLYDTAPAYGDSERLVGDALGSRHDCVLATKVTVPRGTNGQPLQGRGLAESLEAQLAQSRLLLRRDPLDLVQIHNATVELLQGGELVGLLEAARAQGQLRFIGASVYREAEALAAIDSGRVDVLQVAYSLLDQRMAPRVFPAAQAAGVGILARSAFLKGVLTDKAQFLPPALAPLRDAAERARVALGVDWRGLPPAALRFGLSAPAVATVLFGARSDDELEAAVVAAAAGPLPPELLARTPALALEDEQLLDPSRWPAL